MALRNLIFNKRSSWYKRAYIPFQLVEAHYAMKILTFCFSKDLDKLSERLDALGRLVHAKKPEFVTIQGISTEGLKKLRTLQWAARYNVSAPPITTDNRKKPWCVILSIYPPKEMKWFNYRDPENSYRYVLWCEIVMNDKQKQPHLLTIATTQLEQGGTQEISEFREKQLNQALFCLRETEDTILAGDLGLIDILDGDMELQTWKDSWLSITGNTADTGHTFVPKDNTLIPEKEWPSLRSDRLIHRVRRYRLEAVEVVGMEVDPVLEGHISQHYGLMATFQLLDNSTFLPSHPPAEVPCIFTRLHE